MGLGGYTMGSNVTLNPAVKTSPGISKLVLLGGPGMPDQMDSTLLDVKIDVIITNGVKDGLLRSHYQAFEATKLTILPEGGN